MCECFIYLIVWEIGTIPKATVWENVVWILITHTLQVERVTKRENKIKIQHQNQFIFGNIDSVKMKWQKKLKIYIGCHRLK